MSRMLLLQLERFGQLSPEERLALANLTVRHHSVAGGRKLCEEGDRQASLNVVVAGYACLDAEFPTGIRQILAWLLPGDLHDRGPSSWWMIDHSIRTLSSVELARIPYGEITSVSERFPRIARALELSRAVQQATLHQWLLNLGHRNALERTAHLLCELVTRLRYLGLMQGSSCELPLKQSDLADALGISPIHLNRTLKEIERRNLARFVRRRLTVEDWDGLQAMCAFRPEYLFAGGPAPAAEESRAARVAPMGEALDGAQRRA